MIVKKPVRTAPGLANYSTWKKGLDIVLASVLLIPGLPLIMFLVVVVRATSRGPGIYKQERTGKNGKSFTMYKLRSMRLDAETPTGGPVWSQPDDPRITKLGKWLRQTHLDELPQLFNVLKGEMSLVGPRPERPKIVAALAKQIPRYRSRLDVAPGVTGLAQINLPPDIDLNSVRKKLYLDQAYIDDLSFWLDLRLLLCTFVKIIGVDGQWAIGVLKLHRGVPKLTPLTNSENQSPDLNGILSGAEEEFQHESAHRNPPQPAAPPVAVSIAPTIAVSKPISRQRSAAQVSVNKPR